jgi:hypothetical protein
MEERDIDTYLDLLEIIEKDIKTLSLTDYKEMSVRKQALLEGVRRLTSSISTKLELLYTYRK